MADSHATPDPVMRDFTHGVPGWLVGFIFGVFVGMLVLGYALGWK